MALIYNGNTVKAITYNNKDVNKLNYGDTLVWCKYFKLTKTFESGASLFTITRTSTNMPGVATGVSLNNNDTIYYGDVLTARVERAAGYAISVTDHGTYTHSTIVKNYTVNSDLTIAASAHYDYSYEITIIDESDELGNVVYKLRNKYNGAIDVAYSIYCEMRRGTARLTQQITTGTVTVAGNSTITVCSQKIPNNGSYIFFGSCIKLRSRYYRFEGTPIMQTAGSVNIGTYPNMAANSSGSGSSVT